MAYPILAPRDTWYKGTTKRSTITAIEIKDSYTPTGTVVEQWDASEAQDGNITCYIEGTKLTIAGNGSGKIQANADSEYVFTDGKNHVDFFNHVKDPINFEYFDLSKATTIANCFSFSSIKGNFNQLDTSNLEEFNRAFVGCTFETLDLSSWDTKKVKNISHLFADCHNLKKLNISNWEVPNVEIMDALFNDCASLETIDLRNFKTSNCITFNQMFERCTNLKRIYGLENFDTSNAWGAKGSSSFGEAFLDAQHLEEINLSTFDIRMLVKPSTGNQTIRWCDNFFGRNYRLKKVIFGPNFDIAKSGLLEYYPDNVPKLHAPDPTYIPGADGNWYDISGKAYTPEEAIMTVPNTYYASKQLAMDEPMMIKNGTLINIGESIRGKIKTETKYLPSEMDEAISSIATASDVPLAKGVKF